jgi:enamine deaminase RidA (YjgF/YER057c/UK114 family)
MSKTVEYLNPKGACPAQGLYSHVGALSGGPMMFIAGQLAVAADGGVVGRNDFGAQFAQVFGNLGDVLRGIGADWNDVIKFTTYMVHSQDIDMFMDLRADLFPKLFDGPLFPPNTLLMVDRLVKEEFLVEVEAVVAGRP